MGDELGGASWINGLIDGAKWQDEFWSIGGADDKNAAMVIAQDYSDYLSNACRR